MSLRTGLTPFITLLICTLVLSSCTGFRHRENLRNGLIVLDLTQSDFLSIWERPSFTQAISGDEIIKSGIAGWGGFFFKGREMYELWDYRQRETQLVFYGGKLVAWKTSLPVGELAAREPAYLLHAKPARGNDLSTPLSRPDTMKLEGELRIPVDRDAPLTQ